MRAALSMTPALRCSLAALFVLAQALSGPLAAAAPSGPATMGGMQIFCTAKGVTPRPISATPTPVPAFLLTPDMPVPAPHPAKDCASCLTCQFIAGPALPVSSQAIGAAHGRPCRTVHRSMDSASAAARSGPAMPARAPPADPI